MTVRRLFARDLPPDGGPVTLAEASSRHVRVLRLAEGDVVELFDGRGHEARATIVTLDERVVCDCQRPADARSHGPRVVLMLAIPKGGKLDDCVRMATELGVDEIALVAAERSVPRWDSSKARTRLERLARITEEAAAQCERATLPLLHGPKTCAAWLESMPAGARGIVFGARAHDRLVLGELPEQIWCAVGPEGGFSPAELDAFSEAGFALASLGPRVLRVDTAVAAALTVVQDRAAGTQPR